MKKNTKKEELIHVRLTPDELLETKRDILSLQMGILKLVKTIQRYHLLRNRELSKKYELKKNLKKTTLSLKTLRTGLPELKVPEIIKEHHRKAKTPAHEITSYTPSTDKTIEQQLEEIQNRLSQL